MPSTTTTRESPVGEDFDVLVIHPVLLDFVIAERIFDTIIRPYSEVWDMGNESGRHRVYGMSQKTFKLFGDFSIYPGEEWEIYARKNEQILYKVGVIALLTSWGPSEIQGVLY
jgi:hypothetical protein